MSKPRQMQPKPRRPALTAEDIKVGKTYRGKHPATIRGQVNDRRVLHVSTFGGVQYDSSSVADGRQFPSAPMETFLKWASHEVF